MFWQLRNWYKRKNVTVIGDNTVSNLTMQVRRDEFARFYGERKFDFDLQQNVFVNVSYVLPIYICNAIEVTDYLYAKKTVTNLSILFNKPSTICLMKLMKLPGVSVAQY